MSKIQSEARDVAADWVDEDGAPPVEDLADRIVDLVMDACIAACERKPTDPVQAKRGLLMARERLRELHK